MSIFLILLRRELAAFFLSITGYIIIAAVTLLISASFCLFINNLGSNPFLMPVTELFFNSQLFWFVLILVTPVITMRLFSLEKASGTYETLMTTPIGEMEVVMAKFTAALIFYLVAWLPTLACLFIVGHFTNQTSALDAGTLGGTFLGILLSGCLFLSMGCFASSLTQSQIVAAMLSLLIGVILFIVAFFGANDSRNQPMGIAVCVVVFQFVQANGGFFARRRGYPNCDFLCDSHFFLFVPDLARGGKPPLEITWPPNVTPVSLRAAAGRSALTSLCALCWFWRWS